MYCSVGNRGSADVDTGRDGTGGGALISVASAPLIIGPLESVILRDFVVPPVARLNIEGILARLNEEEVPSGGCID